MTKEKKERQLREPQKYDRFIEFMGVPRPFRQRRFGFKNEGEFARIYGLEHATLSRWKKRKSYKKRVSEECFEWLVEQEPLIYAGMAKGSAEGNPAMVKLYLQYVKKWQEETGLNIKGKIDVAGIAKAVKEQKGEK